MATLTEYPLLDGWVQRDSVQETFSAIRDAASGTVVDDTSTFAYNPSLRVNGTPDWIALGRVIVLFDTSSLTSFANISAGVLSFCSFDKTNTFSTAPTFDIYTSTPASNYALATGDYSQLGITSQTGSPITHANWNAADTGVYNDFTFNATGRGNISKTGISKFGLRTANWDADNSPPTPGTDLLYFRCGIRLSEYIGTSQDPKLVVTYEVPPSAPTNVAATDGTYTDKVRITWTASAGATNYTVWRDGSNVSGTLGDVATYDDTGAATPTITAGSTVATDGSSTANVGLSLSGTSANNGTTHSYTVRASNGAGTSADSTANTGYRGVGSLTYQWNRSAGDSDAAYSTLAGATSSTYSDTGAPAPTITAGSSVASDGTSSLHVALSLSGTSANAGAGRYYTCTLNATGASQQTATANRGYIGIGSLTYQWQRSAADSDASYSNIVGATTTPYNDTGAPSDGSGRYFKCVLDATGATQQTSSSDRGYRGSLGPATLKTVNGVAVASVKTINGVAIASVKTWGDIA